MLFESTEVVRGSFKSRFLFLEVIYMVVLEAFLMVFKVRYFLFVLFFAGRGRAGFSYGRSRAWVA